MMSFPKAGAGEDCAIDELVEGRMELEVVLPDGRQVRLTVERRTPMMDLLVQATSANKISPGGHVIHVWPNGIKGSVQYKPNTPIGSLDTNTIFIVPKRNVIEPAIKRMPKLANRPFEPTFRLQVHLPRNQLTVVRTSPRMTVAELRHLVCNDKGLDAAKYQLVHPNVPTQALTGTITMAEYGSTEISLLSNSCIQAHICNSTPDIFAYSTREDEKNTKGADIKKIIGNNIINSNESMEHLSKKEVLAMTSRTGVATTKKRRPAPPPPVPPSSHSRQSSDSSGYHEEVFGEPSSGPESGGSSSGVSSIEGTISCEGSKSSQIVGHKKRPAPPPPSIKKEVEESIESPPELVADTNTQVELTDDLVIPNVVAVAQSERVEIQPIPCKLEEAVVVHQMTRKRKDSEVTVDDVTIHAHTQKPPKVVEVAPRKKESAERGKDESQAVTKLDIARLSARIEQTVTQQEIASHIEAAFCTLDVVPSAHRGQGVGAPSHPKKAPPTLKRRSPSNEDLPGVRKPTPPVESNVTTTERLPVDVIPTRLNNFSIRSYADHSDERVETRQPEATTRASSRVGKAESFASGHRPSKYGGPGVRIGSFLERSEKAKPNDNKVYGVEGSVRGIKGRVRLRCTELVDRNASFPTLSNRSASLLNLVPEKVPDSRRRKSVVDSVKGSGLKRSLSAQNLAEKSDFESEQERLQQEYIRLQKQFVLWQKQLLSNHTVLQEELIMPVSSVPTRTLRQSHSLPNGVPETVPPTVNDDDQQRNRVDNADTVRSSFVSRSLSCEPTEEISASLRRAAIDIPLSEAIVTHIKNGVSTLRSSTNKTHFKPPQVRVSTKSRQRLPPEIRRESDSAPDILARIHEELKMHKILRTPSEMSLNKEQINTLPKVNSNQPVQEVIETKSNSTNGHLSSTESEERPMPKNGHLMKSISSLPKNFTINDRLTSVFEATLRSESHNETRCRPNGFIHQSSTSKQNGMDVTLKENSVSTDRVKSSTELPSSVTPPPPPPPIPTTLFSKKDKVGNLETKTNGYTSSAKKIQRANVLDPREELMLEVRNFGGRKALRKVSQDFNS